MSKTIILPIVALFVLLLKSTFGVNITESDQSVIENGVEAVVLGATLLYGIYTNHRKDVKKDGEEGDKEA